MVSLFTDLWYNVCIFRGIVCIRGIYDGSDKDVIMVCFIGRIDSFVLW